MCRVYIQIVDSKTGIYQAGMIDEPVKEGFEILNALKHFGVDSVDWEYSNITFFDGIGTFSSGTVSETTKVVSIICIE